MATLQTKLPFNSNFFNLREIKYEDLEKELIKRDVPVLLLNNEGVISAYKSVRDQVIFTSKRIIVINVQGLTGKRTSYVSYPYSRIQYWGIQTAGVLDIDCELIVAFTNGELLRFDFSYKTNVKEISTAMSSYIL